MPKNDARAVSYYRLACKGGYATGCNNLGVMHETGRGHRRRDMRAAVKHYRHACKLGETAACVNAGAILVQGRGKVTAAPKEAARLFAHACEKRRAEACFNLASLTKKGLGVARDEAKARRLKQRACELGLPRACRELSR